MSTLTVTTNHQPRELVSLADIPARYADDFDYFDEDEKYSPRLFKYRGYYYDAHEFLRAEDFPGWNGQHGESYFSGVLIKWVDDCDRIIVGRYYC